MDDGCVASRVALTTSSALLHMTGRNSAMDPKFVNFSGRKPVEVAIAVTPDQNWCIGAS